MQRQPPRPRNEDRQAPRGEVGSPLLAPLPEEPPGALLGLVGQMGEVIALGSWLPVGFESRNSLFSLLSHLPWPPTGQYCA